MAKCVVCGSVFEDEDSLTFVDDLDGFVCDACLEAEDFIMCEDCGEWHAKRDMFYIEDQHKYVCADCVRNSDEYRRCEDCGEWHTLDDSTYIENKDKYVCNDCRDQGDYGQCPDCEKWFTTDYLDHYIEDEDYFICGDCYCNGDYFCCESCSNYYTMDNAHSTEDGTLCDSCYEDYENNHDFSTLRDYHEGVGRKGDYNMEHIEMSIAFQRGFMTLHTHVKLGIELEIDKGGESDENAEILLETLGHDHAIASTDGSLSDGLELVSCPGDYEAQMSILNWKDTMEKAKELGYVSHNGGTCGLHTHVDREYFLVNGCTNTMAENKIALVFANNVEWLKKFSRRENWSYCEIDEESTYHETVHDIIKNKTTKNKKNRGHHTALNFSNSRTIEFRLWRGTLKFNTFVATLQLVTMLCQLVRYRSLASCAKIDLNTFKKFAQICGYKEFATYLQERKIA